jgi:hypothetical protein
VEIAPQGGAFQPVREMSTPQEAKDYLTQAYQNSQQIVVMRGGQKLTLPAAGAPAAAQPAGGAGGTGGAGGGTPLSQQLEAIQQVPTPPAD